MTYATDVYLGIDGGGTKCKARLEDAQGNLLAEAIAGPANAARNLTGSVKAVLEASEKAIALPPDPETRNWTKTFLQSASSSRQHSAR